MSMFYLVILLWQTEITYLPRFLALFTFHAARESRVYADLFTSFMVSEIWRI